jgi:endoglucanase
MIKLLALTLIAIVISRTNAQNVAIGSAGSYDYGKVLGASILFYEAQRTGKLPTDNRITWRHDSMMDDKGDAGEDLTGGYFDAGDFVKFGFPMAFSMTILSWGVIDYHDAYTAAGELSNIQKTIKWGTDWILKAHIKDHELYGQVGDGGEDHAYWGRPEDWPASKKRPAFKITDAKPGSDLAGETAAALAAASVVFKTADSAYSTKLLQHARTLYDFANTKRAKYSDSITQASGYYRSMNSYGDELGWAAAWMYWVTNETKYKTDFEAHFQEFKLMEMIDKAYASETGKPRFFWDDKTPGLWLLMARLTKNETYINLIQTYLTFLVKEAPKSPKGMVYYAEVWGTLRHSSNAALLALQAAEFVGINVTEFRAFAKKQIDYALGDGPGHSFVVGVGTNPPTHVHHRAASCYNNGTCEGTGSSVANPHVLTGALAGGPGKDDAYKDDRGDYQHNEVALDFNAGFTSASAGLAHLKAKGYF